MRLFAMPTPRRSRVGSSSRPPTTLPRSGRSCPPDALAKRRDELRRGGEGLDYDSFVSGAAEVHRSDLGRRCERATRLEAEGSPEVLMKTGRATA